jgi:hypothetical protein
MRAASFPDRAQMPSAINEFMTMIPSPTGQLEAHLEHSPSATRAIVICHPHPQYGGSMHDAVVDTVDSGAPSCICNAAVQLSRRRRQHRPIR